MRQDCVLDGAAEGEAFDALCRPISGDFFAAHAPDFFGVTLKEDIEEAFAKLVADPIFEVARIADRKETRFEPGQNAEDRFKDAELDQRLERLQRVGEKLARVKDARGTGAHEHVVGQNLRPKIFDRFRFGEKAVTANVEMKPLVGGGAGNPTNVSRVRFHDRHIDIVLGEEIRCRESGWPRADDSNSCFHSITPPSCPG